VRDFLGDKDFLRNWRAWRPTQQVPSLERPIAEYVMKGGHTGSDLL
jgi:hypothetical protein